MSYDPPRPEALPPLQEEPPATVPFVAGPLRAGAADAPHARLGQRKPGSAEGSRQEIAPEALSRFLEEAQVTNQLDHPGVVPVHELGVDAEGAVYFTLKLVRGHDLRTTSDMVAEGRRTPSIDFQARPVER